MYTHGSRDAKRSVRTKPCNVLKKEKNSMTKPQPVCRYTLAGCLRWKSLWASQDQRQLAHQASCNCALCSPAYTQTQITTLWKNKNRTTQYFLKVSVFSFLFRFIFFSVRIIPKYNFNTASRKKWRMLVFCSWNRSLINSTQDYMVVRLTHVLPKTQNWVHPGLENKHTAKHV